MQACKLKIKIHASYEAWISFKKIFALAFLLQFLQLFCNAQNKYTVELNIANSNGKKALFCNAYSNNDRTHTSNVDTAYFIDNKCIFKGEFKDLSFYSVALDSTANFIPFLIDKGKIVIKGNSIDYLWKTVKIGQSPQNDMMFNVKTQTELIEMMRINFQDSMQIHGLNNEKKIYYRNKIEECDNNLANYLFKYVTSNPSSYYAFYLLKMTYEFSTRSKELAKITFPLFSEQIKTSDEGKYLYFLLFGVGTKNLIGKAFPSVLFYNSERQLVSLPIEKKGIYLLDYWASWCIPCIANLPDFRALNKTYYSVGFRLISISVDTKFNTWISSSKKHRINWANYITTNGFNSVDVKTFAIRAIPFTIFIDNGKIKDCKSYA